MTTKQALGKEETKKKRKKGKEGNCIIYKRKTE
jgi:hypothetical protein